MFPPFMFERRKSESQANPPVPVPSMSPTQSQPVSSPGHDFSQVPTMGPAPQPTPSPSLLSFGKHWIYDDPAHKFQNPSRGSLSQMTDTSPTLYSYLVGRTNRALDRSGYGLPAPLLQSLSTNVEKEKTGEIKQYQAHAKEVASFGSHFFKKGLLGGDPEARNPIYPVGMFMNTMGAIGTAAKEGMEEDIRRKTGRYQ
jgi:hypothetical protein